jgi:tRNA-splicing ligase RtcB
VVHAPVVSPPLHRLVRAFARAGIDLQRDGAVWRVRLLATADAPAAEILLPAELPLELKAVQQLVQLAATHHPDGGRVCRACATPDFHPGDSGVAIGSVVESEDLLIPQAVGTDINCGMRLHALDLTLDEFLAHKATFIERLKGDYLLGTRDVVHDAPTLRAALAGGVPAWVEGLRRGAHGMLAHADLTQLTGEVDRHYQQGVFGPGDPDWLPDLPTSGRIREDGLGTVGRGNHFVELQVVEEVLDPKRAWAWGVRRGQLVAMIHSGSRHVGGHIGKRWVEKAREAWPTASKYPESGIFSLSWQSTPDLCRAYLEAEATAAHYGAINRALLGELLRRRLREVYGDRAAALVYDLPHNLTLKEGDRYVARKGACPAHAEQPVIIPGSMGAASFLLVGHGSEQCIRSASHGAGRAVARIDMSRVKQLGLDGVECITLRDERRVEEAPAAYKPIGPVIDAQVEAGLVSVVARFRPLVTFKA